MKPKRVECDKCKQFIEPEISSMKDDHHIDFDISQKAKCKLGKRVMFRIPHLTDNGYPLDFGGYFRYCNDFQVK